MTLEETVEYFRDMVESCGAYELCPCFHDDMEMTKIALSALEKQVAKKPKAHTVDVERLKIDDVIFFKGTTVYRCPNCNDFISRIYDFCYKCGQALDWRVTK